MAHLKWLTVIGFNLHNLHLFTEKELDELDSHAARQRNPGFYSLLVAFERGAHRQTAPDLRTASVQLVSRAGARVIMAEIYLQEAVSALAKFNKHRDRIYVITRDDGVRQIRFARLADFAPQNALEQAFSSVIKRSPQYREVAARVDALGDRLAVGQEQASEALAYLNDVASRYAEEFERYHPGAPHPKPRFTTSEINRLEQQAIRDADPAQRARYSAYICEAWGFNRDGK